ncbi:MAG TPA: arginine--tRNA ligase [Actinomycetota bacterium]|nr:arginine--tRNA ligase [Actinomycetota bacterium]
MIEGHLADLVRAATRKLWPDDADVDFDVVRPRQKEHGDFSTNAALVLAAAHGLKPRDVAEALVRELPPSDLVSGAEVAGPGFVNFRVTTTWLHDVLGRVEREGDRFGRLEADPPRRIQVEFVSTNPTGPLHVGHARNGAVGDALANLLEAAGHDVEREYYLNDHGRQMDLFGWSVEARYLELLGRPATFPEEGYRGAYVVRLAEEIRRDRGDGLADLPDDERAAAFREEAEARAIAWIRSSLERFRVRFDSWFSQRRMVEAGGVAAAVEKLRGLGHAYDAEGAVWFRSTAFGDDKDRVLIRSNGEPTYFASDCAYLLDKFGRGFDHVIYVWGADHHGDVARVRGVARAFAFDPDAVEILVYQFVTFTRGGEPVRMSKRTGDVITLDELLDEVGADAARYTLVSRSIDTPIEFDFEAVTRQSLDNPVYYVQYAHARIASLIRYAEGRGTRLEPFDPGVAARLEHEAELDVLRKLSAYPEQVRMAADLRAPYRLARYAEELSADFHRFYTECRVVTDDEDLTQARLRLSAATRQVLANVLGLLGVSAPESMERLDER